MSGFKITFLLLRLLRPVCQALAGGQPCPSHISPPPLCTYRKKFYNLVIALFFVLNISVGFFSPYLGVYWQINQYVKSKNVINCYKNINENNCEKIAYFEAFNGGKWFNDKKFKRSVDFLKNNKISIFYE